jgi:hypothetical protein
MTTANNRRRVARATESFRNAAETIGPIESGMALFAITRGQWSMIDAILHCLDQTGPARLTLWTWCIAEYEVQCFDRLRMDSRLSSATLIIDTAALKRNAPLLREWREAHGPDSIKYVVNHAKIATLDGGGFRLLLRGSMNLNYNPRFEQFDLTEGGPDFDLVRQIESELPTLPDDHAYMDLRRASKLDEAFAEQQLIPFQGVKTWQK